MRGCSPTVRGSGGAARAARRARGARPPGHDRVPRSRRRASRARPVSARYTDGHVGVFNIATPPEHRGRGYGRAVTARVVADGVRAGARTAYLQASPMGLGVYQRMGFRTGETWRCHYPG